MDGFIILMFIIAAVIFAVIINIISNRNKVKRFAERLKRNFGKFERRNRE